jgi:hypothetical protein
MSATLKSGAAADGAAETVAEVLQSRSDHAAAKLQWSAQTTTMERASRHTSVKDVGLHAVS